jgi:flavin reductase (DIM6/NTAB) family NADH-FMN oxidoreductase RutF
MTAPNGNGSAHSAATTAFDFAALTARERYKLLIGAVIPRPIALVTTVSKEGIANAAPFSFFNCLSADPAILALGVEYRPSGAQKDTGRNIRETLGFTVHIVSEAILAAMNVCAVPFEPGVDELHEAGLATAPGVKAPSPRIVAAPVAFECRLHTSLGIGNSREIILGEVVYAHFHADLVNSDNHHVDPVALDAIGRLGGHGYSLTREMFDLPTMSLAQWQAGSIPERVPHAPFVPAPPRR